MDKLGIKATIYDIFGYAIPGCLLLISYLGLTIDVNNFDLAKLIKIEINWPFAVAAFIVSYIVGHLLSSISSVVFENPLSKQMFSTVLGVMFKTEMYDDACEKKLGKKYNECGERAVIVYCQNNHPVIYETAFVFLAIYGFSRNIAMTMIILLPLFIDRQFYPVWNLVYIVSLVFMVWHYLRFKNYFSHQIASSLYLPSKSP